MRYGRHLLALLALPSLALASFACQALNEGVKFDFTALKGAHSITLEHKDEFAVTSNTIWTINPCGPIGKKKAIPDEEQCPAGTQVCGIERVSKSNNETIVSVIPIAGDINGSSTDEKVQRLKTSGDNSDQGKEGLRVVLHGGLFNDVKQQAIIEFICDPGRTGLEDEPSDTEGDDSEMENKEKEKREAVNNGRSLQFISYIATDNKPTLRLEWKTKYACESMNGGDGIPDSGNSWGFFTWFIIILFLGVAAYLIFGSWLNYNRYGARGWDLLPHSDTIRDVPYLLKDWSRRVVGTLQGRGGGRGGYSAV